MDINLTIAQNIRGLREKKRLTLDSAASITGVSRSMLAQIEKGDVNPTISVLWKIATGYKVSFTSLLENAKNDDTYIPVSSVQPMTESDGKYINYPTFPFDDRRQFEMYRIIIAPGGELDAQPHLALSEEYITVFAGSMEVKLEDKTHTLTVGDSLRFKADQKHSYRNVGDAPVMLSMLIYYTNE